MRERAARGLVAEYDEEAALVSALRALRAEGYARLDALTPFPSDAVCEALELSRSRLPWLTGLGFASGGALAYLVLFWTQVVDYPLNVGGRHPHPWPSFVPITFESAVLLGGLLTFFGFFLACGLPRLWHPLFEVAGIERASVDRWFLVVDAADAPYTERTRALLEATGARRVETYGYLEGARAAEERR